jgi:hypothetical protein
MTRNDRLKQQKHEYYERNKDKILARVREYRNENREKIKTYQHDHRIKYPEKYNIHRRFTNRLLRGACCIRCGKTSGLCFHHVNPVTRVAMISRMRNPVKMLDEIKKCAILCKACHCKEHNPAKGKKHERWHDDSFRNVAFGNS